MSRPMKLVEDLPAEPDEVSSIVTPERHPGLTAALEGPDGARVRAELAQLFRGRFKVRAPRRPVSRLGRLQFLDEDEVVLLKDISTSGVRLLMESHPEVDLMTLPRIVLSVNTDTRNHALAVAFVRLCGTVGKHVDVGFRFVDPGPQHQDVVANLRNYLFNPR
ncbi:MAG TPA: PilZ domain-containing protein [Polyangia bacterium]|nr:PilZ domain-containing protein [Polyangia bacterium]